MAGYEVCTNNIKVENKTKKLVLNDWDLMEAEVPRLSSALAYG